MMIDNSHSSDTSPLGAGLFILKIAKADQMIAVMVLFLGDHRKSLALTTGSFQFYLMRFELL